MQFPRSWKVGCSTVALMLAVAAARLAAQEPTAKEDPSAKPEPPKTAQVGQAAPDFVLLDCTGQKHALSESKDKLVVLEWLNKECPWSDRGRPVVHETYRKYADKGVVWFGIDSTHGRRPEVNVQYAKDREIPFPILLDEDGKVGRLYGAKTTPHVFVISKGKLVYAGALHNDPQGDKPKSEVRNYLDEALAAVLAGKDVPVAETKPWGCTVKYREDRKADGHKARGAEPGTDRESKSRT